MIRALSLCARTLNAVQRAKRLSALEEPRQCLGFARGVCARPEKWPALEEPRPEPFFERGCFIPTGEKHSARFSPRDGDCRVKAMPRGRNTDRLGAGTLQHCSRLAQWSLLILGSGATGVPRDAAPCTRRSPFTTSADGASSVRARKPRFSQPFSPNVVFYPRAHPRFHSKGT